MRSKPCDAALAEHNMHVLSHANKGRRQRGHDAHQRQPLRWWCPIEPEAIVVFGDSRCKIRMPAAGGIQHERRCWLHVHARLADSVCDEVAKKKRAARDRTASVEHL